MSWGNGIEGGESQPSRVNRLCSLTSSSLFLMSCWTSSISSAASVALIFQPSWSIFKPNTTNKSTDTQRVMWGGMNWMKTIPNTADKTVINARAEIAPANTVSRGYFYNERRVNHNTLFGFQLTICLLTIDIIAAIKNVLSPISETMITEKLAMKAWINPKFEPFGGSSVVKLPSDFLESICGFSSASSSFGAKSPNTKAIWQKKTTAIVTNVRSLLTAVCELAML